MENTISSNDINLKSSTDVEIDSSTDINIKYREYVDEFSDMITRLCLIHTGNYADAADCYQNVFFKLFKEMKLGGPANVKAWLITVTLNECRSVLRYRLRKNTVNLNELIIPFHDKSDIELTELIFKLPPKQRDVIYLYYYEEYKIKEISQMTGMKENTVKSHLKRGREQLKEFLTD